MARVLLVDDDLVERDVHRAELTHAGHDVLCARKGLEAKHMAAMWRPDVVVVDGVTPGADMEATTRLAGRLPVVINSPHAGLGDDGSLHGRQKFLVKSDAGELARVVAQLLTEGPGGRTRPRAEISG